MKNAADSILGGGMKSAPVFLYDTIIDNDFGIVRYCIVNNIDFIDFEKLKTMSYMQLVGDIYRRKDGNPLAMFAKNNIISRQELDRFYNDNIDSIEVLNNSVLTDVENLVIAFGKATDINPCILCKSQMQIDKLNSTSSLKDIQKVTMNDVNLPTRTEVYMKYISDLSMFTDMTATSFYISSCGVNLVEDNSDLDMNRDEVIPIAEKGNKINIFDMYRMDVIGRYNHE